MLNEDYKEALLFACSLCQDVAEQYFSQGMRLAFNDELAAVHEVLDENEPVELPFHVLETMKDPLIQEMHTVGNKCLEVKQSLLNLNNIKEEEVNDHVDALEQEFVPLVPQTRKPTRKQILNGLFKVTGLLAVDMTETLQIWTAREGYRIKRKREKYFYNNHVLFYDCQDVNLKLFAEATEMVTDLLFHLPTVPGFTKNVRIPKELKYYPFHLCGGKLVISKSAREIGTVKVHLSARR